MANEDGRPIEEQLAALGIPDDLPEAALQDAPVPDAAALARIRARTFAKAGLPPSATPRRTRRFVVLSVAAAVVFALAAVAVLGVGPEKVWGTFVRFVPGFGLKLSSAPDGADDRAVWLSAPRAVRMERDGAWVEVQGLVVTGGYVRARIYSERVTLALVGVHDDNNVDVGTLVSVVTEQGTILQKWGHFAASSDRSGRSYQGQFTFKGTVPGESRKIIVVVKDTPEWRLEIPLVPGDQLVTAEAFGPSATVGSLTLSTQITPSADKTAVTIMARSTNGAGVKELLGDITLSVGDWTTNVKPSHGSNPFDQLWYYTADALPVGAKSVTLRVSRLHVVEPGGATVRLKVADAALNQTVQLGRWPLRLVRAELHPTELWLYADPGPPQVVQDAAGTHSDYLYFISGGAVNGEDDAVSGFVRDPFYSGPTLMKPADKGLLMFQFNLSPPLRVADSVTVTMKGPEVLAEGPWVITVPLGQQAK